MAKTHLQHVATAAAINIDRIVAWLEARPRATTRTSRFAALAPARALKPDEEAASVLASHPQSKLCCPAPLARILYYINIYRST